MPRPKKPHVRCYACGRRQKGGGICPACRALCRISGADNDGPAAVRDGAFARRLAEHQRRAALSLPLFD